MDMTESYDYRYDRMVTVNWYDWWVDRTDEMFDRLLEYSFQKHSDKILFVKLSFVSLMD